MMPSFIDFLKIAAEVLGVSPFLYDFVEMLGPIRKFLNRITKAPISLVDSFVELLQISGYVL